MKDIVPELLEKIQASFDKKISEDKAIAEFMEKVKVGTATMEELSLYGRKLGDHLADTLAESITPDVLPDEKMYFNIADRIISTTMHNNYDLANAAAVAVQKSIDLEAGIGLNAVKAAYPEERVMSVINGLTDKTATWETIQRRMNEPVRNISQSFIDDFMLTNAEFRSRAGLKTRIVRTPFGKCCDWCRELAGSYAYPDDTPKDIFRRHDNCRCTVVYKSEKGTQNVWTKRWNEAENKAVIERRKQIGISDNRRKSVTALYYGTATPGMGVVKREAGLESVKHKDEIKVAELLHKKFGGDITILNEVNQQSIKTADYLWNDKLWDLKKATTEKSADSAVRKGIKQIHENPGGIILDYRGNEISMEKLMEIVDRRVIRGQIKELDIMVIQTEELISIYRYKK